MSSLPQKKAEELVIPCDSNCLETIRKFVRQRAGEAGLGRSDVGRLVLAADEVASNIIRHSYHFDWRHKIEILWHLNDDRVVVEIRDDSPVPYLPSMSDFDLPTKIKYRHSNGFGKYLIQNAVDEVQYETIPGSHNRVMLVKFRGSHEGAVKKKDLFLDPYSIAHARSLSLRALFDVWAELGRQTKPEELTRLFLYTVMGQLSTQTVLLLQPHGTASPFEIAAQMGLSKRLPVHDIRLPRHGWVVETLWAHRGPFLSGEFKKIHAPAEEMDVLEKIRSTVLVPIFIQGKLRGILSLGGKRNRQAFTEDDMSLVTLLASHVILLLENLEKEAALSGKGPGEIGSGLREVVRAAIADLAEVSHSHHIPCILEEGPPLHNLQIELPTLKNVILTLLTHILYLSSEGTSISVRLGTEDGEAYLLITYNGRPLLFEKGKEGYNPLIDQLLAGNLKLADCRKVVESEGGKIVVESAKTFGADVGGTDEGQPVAVRLTLPLLEN